MNSFMLMIILKTMPRIDANKYEDGKVQLKPRKEWRNDFFYFLAGFAVSFACLVISQSVPYAGLLLVIGGFFGMVMTLMYAIRAILVYRFYNDLFTDENIKKLVK